MRVVALPEFLSRAKRLLSEEERAAFVDYIGSNRQLGKVIPGLKGAKGCTQDPLGTRQERKARRRTHHLSLRCREGHGLPADGLRQRAAAGPGPARQESNSRGDRGAEGRIGI